MALGEFMGFRTILFMAGSILLTAVSGRALKNPRSHGFYRYFVFEAILALFVLNMPFWFKDPTSPTQLLSWIFLFSSLYLVFHGVTLLIRHGGPTPRESAPENLAFENTATLVTEGIYGYIRHPMYASLMFLAWGIYLKHMGVISSLAVIMATVFLLMAVRMEERENLLFFGPAYADYMRRTKRFIPFVV
jgi:protein-S-isoprenylcysteine O-methyltransferase Ste14